jgi:hypothetical protein
MDDNFAEIQIVHKDFVSDFENKFLKSISDITELGDYYLIELKNFDEITVEDTNATHNINVSIASAITAYARIHMTQFKNNPDFNLYYSDTDSIYIDKVLPDHLVNSKILGKMKLENICKKTVFLSPKVYCLETEDGKVIYKAKGLKHEIELTMNDFENLLNKDAFLEKYQTK